MGGALSRRPVIARETVVVLPSCPRAPFTAPVDEEPEEHDYDYDLVVIGGGSGGLACAKAAADLGKRVACLDFVKPSPQGTTWGLGGTCVNVGCIPKKLMHQAARLGEEVQPQAAATYGWLEGPFSRTGSSCSGSPRSNPAEPKSPAEPPNRPGDQDAKYAAQVEVGSVAATRHDWNVLVRNVDDYIRGLNFNYRSDLAGKGVRYFNALGRFVAPHTVELSKPDAATQRITARRFVIAVGGRPVYPDDVPGCRELAITSDDIFKLKKDPGKTLCIGASYVALECAGFLTGLGKEVHVAYRSVPLRGFDQQMAQIVTDHMRDAGTKFLEKVVPVRVVESAGPGPGHRLQVELQSVVNPTERLVEGYDTVFFAVGRKADTAGLGLDKVGVATDPTGKILADSADCTKCPYIFAIGDVVKGRPELTPVAIRAGRLLADRLYRNATKRMDYVNIPTTVFTPLEYGSVGYSEEQAQEEFGDSNIDVYHSNFTPLEWRLPHHPENLCYVKMIVNTADNERVVGFHIASPNAGEIVQAVAIAMKARATKAVFDDTIGIHPTIAEEITGLATTKRSGASAEKGGC